MSHVRTQYLFDRYYQQTATPEEVSELMEYIARFPEEFAELPALLQAQWESLPVADRQFSAEAGAPVLHKILAARNVRNIRPLYRYGWAAAVLALIATSAAFFITRQHTNTTQIAQANIRPGSSKAILTLADGRTIPLDSNGQQVLHQGHALVSQQGGQLRYETTDNTEGVSYNTLKTPRGGQFQLTLPDGTHVWLNATSSITYPTAFTGNTRNVSITGEVYFDVAAMAAKPFQVKINDATTIQVLGTEFNVNAYTDEAAISTTLINGKIKVSNNNAQGVILNPGQQARINEAGSMSVMNDVDVEQATAWKNGIFNFQGKDLPEVLRQLSRWYDVDVVFAGKIPARKFGGEIQRELQLGQVLTILEKMDVKFKIEGKKLVVLPE